MAEEKPLVGDDGAFFTAKLGQEYEGDGTKALNVLVSGGSATSVGANINEAIYGNSKADFIAKFHISLKEVSESIYWLTLLKNTKLFEYNYDSSINLAEEIKKMLISSINTAKKNQNKTSL